MTLMEYLIKTGSERVAQQCKENMYAVQTLKDFQYVDRDGKDQGVNVREKAKQLVALLRDEDRLREERAHALKTKEKLAQTATGEPSRGQRDTVLLGGHGTAQSTPDTARLWHARNPTFNILGKAHQKKKKNPGGQSAVQCVGFLCTPYGRIPECSRCGSKLKTKMSAAVGGWVAEDPGCLLLPMPACSGLWCP